MYWRRLNVEGLERTQISPALDGFSAHGTIVTLAEGGLSLEHSWSLDSDWSARSLTVEHRGPKGIATLILARDGSGWTVNGMRRPDLEAASEPDLSVTPLCNSIPIRQLSHERGALLTIDTAYVEGDTLSVQRSRQAYERIDERTVRYLDWGVAFGIEALITLDDHGFVTFYEHLFVRVSPQ